MNQKHIICILIVLGYGPIGALLGGTVQMLMIGAIGIFNISFLIHNPSYMMTCSYQWGLVPMLGAGIYVAYCAIQRKVFLPAVYFGITAVLCVFNELYIYRIFYHLTLNEELWLPSSFAMGLPFAMLLWLFFIIPLCIYLYIARRLLAASPYPLLKTTASREIV